MKTDFLYLASQSPRRSQLLDQIGVRHTLLLPDASEDAEALEVVLPGESPIDYVQRVTELKWRAAVQRRLRRGLPMAPILCADTTVALGRRILGKPANPADAIEMLGALSSLAPHRWPCRCLRCASIHSRQLGSGLMWPAVSPWAKRGLMPSRVGRRPALLTFKAVTAASWACHCARPRT
jgi:Maf-like protein